MPPFFARERTHEIGFDLGLGRGAGEAEPSADPHHVRVHRHSFVDSVRRREDDGRRLAPHTPQRQHVFHCLRHFSVKTVDKRPARFPYGARLYSVRTAAVDIPLQLRKRGAKIILGCPVFFEERLRDQVHAFIRALSRKNGCNQKIKRSRMAERASRVGVHFFEPPKDRLW